MSERPFDEERRRLREAMDGEIEKVRAAYRARLEAVDRAEELMRFAASGDDSPPAGTGEPPSELREKLRRLIAGWSGELRIEDARARAVGASPQAIRACLDRMARDGEVRIVKAGGPAEEPIYEVPEPEYGAVAPAEAEP